MKKAGNPPFYEHTFPTSLFLRKYPIKKHQTSSSITMTKLTIPHPFVRTILAIVLGLLVLMILGQSMMSISKSTQLFENFPMIDKTFTHTAMLVLAVFFMLILNKGNLRSYGFTWSLNFPLTKTILVSLLIGLIMALLQNLFVTSKVELPVDNYSFLESILYIWVWASICEEVLTRGLIQGFLDPLKHIGLTVFKHHISLPVIVGALFFGAMHLAMLTMGADIKMVLLIVFFSIILGVIAGYLKEKTNSLVPAILVHFCFNVGGSFLGLVGVL